ncbi:MAG: hypothetical protein WD577_01395 [Bacteroidales bacterium]
MHKNVVYTLLLLILFSGCRKSNYTIEQTEIVTDLGGGTGTTTWSNDKEYLISGFVFVNDGQVLTIEPGTIIRAKAGHGSLASALIIARGGKIVAEGTNIEPIIFTAEGDDLKGSVPLEARGLWGGLIILGNAPINTKEGEDMIEGLPVSEPRSLYGGIDDDDNSGILRYISIRHGGTNIGEGNEINGLTLGGVGRQTIVEYIEVISNEDDGIEIFGGTVNCKNLVVSFCGDDAFDIDQGYRGKCQFLLGINIESSDKALECSGGLQPMQLLPGAFPSIYNATFVGDRRNSSLALLDYNSYGAAHLINSILIHTGKGIAVSNSGTGSSYSIFRNGCLTIQNNEYYDSGDTLLNIYCYNEAGDPFPQENSILRDSIHQWNNVYTNSLGISENSLNLLPNNTVFEHLAPYENSWYEEVSYKGAFGSENWIEGWTLLHEQGLGLISTN